MQVVGLFARKSKLCTPLNIYSTLCTISVGDNASWHHYKYKEKYMRDIPECFYRVSAKALILNDTRDKFLICEEESGWWELPGGGLDWGTSPQEDIPREINEEMGLMVTNVASNPSYFLTYETNKGFWVVNILFETQLQNLDFTPSDECVNIKFVDLDTLPTEKVFPSVRALAEMFNSKNHI